MKTNRHFLFFSALLAFGVQSSVAQSVVSDPLGFNTVVCPPNSDTIVGVPFRPNGSQQGTLASAPAVSGDSATLTLAGSPGFTGDEFANTHYVKFTSGAMDGHFFAITGNTSDTVTIDLNGDDISSVVADDSLLIAKFWTLDTLFPPAEATTTWTETPAGSGTWVQDGHAIVGSSGASLFVRKTEVLLPDKATQGVNLAAQDIFFIDNSATSWVSASGAPNAGATQIWPDTYIIIRHPPSVAHATSYKVSGEVEMGQISLPLATRTDGHQDVAIAIPRPVDLRLDKLNLYESGAFIASPGTSLFVRRDELLMFDNAEAMRNKSASAIYFYHYDSASGTGNWVNSADGTNADADILPAGAGFIIRKYKTTDGATHFWDNTSSYTTP